MSTLKFSGIYLIVHHYVQIMMNVRLFISMQKKKTAFWVQRLELKFLQTKPILFSSTSILDTPLLVNWFQIFYIYSRCQFHQHFMLTFWTSIFSPKNYKAKNITREKLLKALLHKKIAHKMFMKLTLGETSTYHPTPLKKLEFCTSHQKEPAKKADPKIAQKWARKRTPKQAVPKSTQRCAQKVCYIRYTKKHSSSRPPTHSCPTPSLQPYILLLLTKHLACTFS